MKKIDLHVHSKYSEHPAVWFMQRLGAKESYTEPEYIYKLARERGMDFVTITDHNRIDGSILLKEKHPEEVIVGVETTAYFPEDGCKIHILLYGITEKEFEEIQKLRKDVYELREFIRLNNIAYSVAHATYSVNGKLNVEHLQKLILLFDVFEGINGGRNYFFNNSWMELMKNLSPYHIEKLYNKYRIEPFSNEGWIKGFTGGSDDHAGLFIGETYTEMQADSIDDVLAAIKGKKTIPHGRHNDYRSLVFSVYKITYDFLKIKSNGEHNSLFYQISRKIFEPDSWNLKERFKFSRLESRSKHKGDKIGLLLTEAMKEIKKSDTDNPTRKLEIVFDRIGKIADEFLKKILSTMEKSVEKGDIGDLIVKISSALTGIFMIVPFFSSLKHLNNNRKIIDEISKVLSIKLNKRKKKILWFTDTLNDLNGVSETLKELGNIAAQKGSNIKIVTTLSDAEVDETIPSNTINLPHFFTFRLPLYEEYLVKFPSVLKSLEILSKEDPTEIYISTPGPVGLFGLLLARLLNIKSVGVYHTDFSSEVSKITEDESIIEIVKAYEKWFYSNMDMVKVYSKDYFSYLEEMGIERQKIDIFHKGLDGHLFQFKPNAKVLVRKKYNIREGINLLFVGRISKDKNLDFLLDVYRELLKERNDINLILAGDGPYLDALKKKSRGLERVYFLGRIPRKELSYIYSASELFVFPSVTDTFGMVVMEAQACELPAIVSDIGGPKEIVIDGKTGLVAKNNDLLDWTEKIHAILSILGTPVYENMRKYARLKAIERFEWDKVFRNVFGEEIEKEHVYPVRTDNSRRKAVKS